jgi:hypothetical protein
MTLDAVALDTPARAATFSNVGRSRPILTLPRPGAVIAASLPLTVVAHPVIVQQRRYEITEPAEDQYE